MKRKSTFIFVILFFRTYFISGQSNTVEIWMRAFIPNPQNAGQANSEIHPMPYGKSGSFLRLHELTAENLNQCFATDHRGFSTDETVSSRLETKLTIQLSADGTASVTPSNNRTNAAVTTKINCSTGDIIEQKAGDVSRDHLGAPAVADGIVQVIGQAQGINMLVFLARTTAGLSVPAIDYSFDIQWKPSSSSLTASITYGAFPAFEMYVRRPGGAWLTIIQHLPTGAPWRLALDGYGVNTFTESKTVTVPNLMNGKWQSQDPEQRFTIEITENNAKWAERNASGGTLMKEVPIQDLGDGNLRIERANDNEVLSFLGFTPQGLRDAIIAAGPRPSFIIFRKEGTTISGQWNGLTVIKNPNGTFKQNIQPGVRPPKNFVFSKLQ